MVLDLNPPVVLHLTQLVVLVLNLPVVLAPNPLAAPAAQAVLLDKPAPDPDLAPIPPPLSLFHQVAKAAMEAAEEMEEAEATVEAAPARPPALLS